MKTVHLDIVAKIIVALVSRDASSTLINSYVSRVNVELSKSTRSFEREAAMRFFYNGIYDLI
jgi:hypothetical protein